MRIGLLGGSFNPAHAGHLQVARLALERLGLDQVWLLVSPGNPLKPVGGMASRAERMASARSIADGRRIIATEIEQHLHSRYTYRTLRALQRRFPCARFVWLMGADNLVQLPRWQHWVGIARTMPFAVLPRPTYNQRALAGQASHRLRRWQRPAHAAQGLARVRPPAWTFLRVRQTPISATALRRARDMTDQAVISAPTPAPSPAIPPSPGARPTSRRSRLLEGART